MVRFRTAPLAAGLFGLLVLAGCQHTHKHNNACCPCSCQSTRGDPGPGGRHACPGGRPRPSDAGNGPDEADQRATDITVDRAGRAAADSVMAVP